MHHLSLVAARSSGRRVLLIRGDATCLSPCFAMGRSNKKGFSSSKVGDEFFFFFMKFPSSETVSVSPMSKLVSGRRKGCQELYSIISLLSKSLKAARGGGEGGLEDQSVRIPLSKL